ncbi:MAG: hypothetical protein AAFQ77_03480 [Myxococcota bacterium]
MNEGSTARRRCWCGFLLPPFKTLVLAGYTELRSDGHSDGRAGERVELRLCPACGTKIGFPVSGSASRGET